MVAVVAIAASDAFPNRKGSMHPRQQVPIANAGIQKGSALATALVLAIAASKRRASLILQAARIGRRFMASRIGAASGEHHERARR
jgi:molybdenum cofactor biosynthesis enzyme